MSSQFLQRSRLTNAHHRPREANRLNSAADLETNVQTHVIPPQAVRKFPRRVMVRSALEVPRVGGTSSKQEQQMFQRSLATDASRRAIMRINAQTEHLMVASKVRKVVAEVIADEGHLLHLGGLRRRAVIKAMLPALAEHPLPRPRAVAKFATFTSHGPTHPRSATTALLVHSCMLMKSPRKARLAERSTSSNMPL